MPYLKLYNRDKCVQSLGRRVCGGVGQRNKLMKYGEGPRRVLCPWAPNVLATPLGKGSTFLIFSSNFDQFFLFLLKLYLFSSSFWPSGWATRPPGKALATPLHGWTMSRGPGAIKGAPEKETKKRKKKKRKKKMKKEKKKGRKEKRERNFSNTRTRPPPDISPWV